MAIFSDVSTSLGQNALARAISAYSDQEYNDAVRIAGTALVGSDARISTSDEDYFGSIRWTTTLGDLNYTGRSAGGNNPANAVGVSGRTNINLASEDSSEGATTDVNHDSSQYIKTMRTMGATQYNVTQVLTAAPNAIEKVSRDFGNSRARDNDAALVAMLQGVTHTELAARRALGTQTSSTRSATGNTAVNAYGQGYRDGAQLNNDAGFYVDLNGPLNAATARATTSGTTVANDTAGVRKLISSSTGGAAAEGLWQAASAAFADLEPDFFYLVISPETYQDIRAANLLDNQDRITDGNIQVDTLLQGKFRLLVTRTLGSDDFDFTGTTADNPLNIGSKRTSYLMLPGSLYQSDVVVPNPVAFDADESVGRGAGNRELWYRWGNIYHPRGYTWGGSTAQFALNSDYSATSAWTRKEHVGNMGILPIHHA